MPESIRIPLSAHQVQRFAVFKADIDAIQFRFNDTLTAIVAGHVDPTTLEGWDIRLDGATIVCTPPAIALVPDIGPSGVSESAATEPVVQAS